MKQKASTQAEDGSPPSTSHIENTNIMSTSNFIIMWPHYISSLHQHLSIAACVLSARPWSFHDGFTAVLERRTAADPVQRHAQQEHKTLIEQNIPIIVFAAANHHSIAAYEVPLVLGLFIMVSRQSSSAGLPQILFKETPNNSTRRANNITYRSSSLQLCLKSQVCCTTRPRILEVMQYSTWQLKHSARIVKCRWF